MSWLFILLCSIAVMLNVARFVSVYSSPQANQSVLPGNSGWFLNLVIILTWSGLVLVPLILFSRYEILAAIVGLVLYISVNPAIGFALGRTVLKRKLNRKRNLEKFNNLVHQVRYQIFAEDMKFKQQAGLVLLMFLQHRELIQAGVLPELDFELLTGDEMPAMMCLAQFATKAQQAQDHQKFLSGLDDEEVELILEFGQIWAKTI